MVGAECAAADGRPARDRLFSNAAFKAARDALPRCIPRATLQLADTLLRAKLGRGLHESLASATVRDIMLGRDVAVSPSAADAAAASISFDEDGGEPERRVDGILRMDACFLEGLQEDSDLYLRARYAANVSAALASAPPPTPLVLLREGMPLSAPVPWDG